ncbi:MBL fold metallo-hydrolase [Phenylobacterium sp. Root77]|jgi:ribonuclease J|uniref:ribonuclease J n=1 Tax=unclassified Phenylobacterium TaxID=2640670 RepID=UPI0006F5E9D7|nr:MULTISPECIES: ribonuclease J [unclassified Phenylobacterium]KQW71538.1 MBL fold metallo-hydrolase [Phenylobacterium sp. Root1277]KQW94458.1 MBL fold metallo-hydrolase [Phenylobacterium sp. Root1290]KRC44152.1 MBL fold metallo-hydrolase [Phenylobacterium sp. Root77]
MKAKDQDELVFLPLGGSNEIGMNFNLYGYGPAHARKWIVVDLGVTFGDQTTPGVEIILPDPEFIRDYAKNIIGIVLTHAHEDHIGAVSWLWPQLRAPLYATPFTAFLLREKLRENEECAEAEITEIPLSGKIQLGPFEVELITLTHSIPEPNGLAIRTPLGTVLHTGDWKIDPDPVLGSVTDEAAIQKLGDEGVLAMVCDSTNVFVDGESGSEADVKEALAGLIGGLSGKVAVACFASNVARMDSVIRAAEAADRSVCLVGRSMHRMAAAAKSVGLLEGVREFLSEQQAAALPGNDVLYLCTGSQGEPRAALSRIADGSHPHVKLGAGDACVFSSRVIPGNEIPIRNLQNRLADRGVRLYTERDHPGIHVSGHPCRDELAQMYAWARPQIAVPTHGERRHLLEHAAFAKDLQVPQSVAPRNGDMVRLAPGRAEIIDEVPAGRIYVDAGVLTPENGDALRERRHAAYNGVLAVSVVLDGRGKIAAGPQVRALGLPADDDYPMDEVLDDLAKEASQALGRLQGEQREFDEEVETVMSRAVKKASQRIWGKRPVVETTVLRI